MSVFTVLWLDCNGCTVERFTPVQPQGKASQVRELADAAGWITNLRNQGQDFGPRCVAALNLGQVLARGICSACGHDRALTKQVLVVSHQARRDGTRFRCPGGGRPPARVTLAAPGAATATGWKSLI